MRADRIDHRGLLADEQLACAMQHQAALLLRSLGRNEPHVRPGNRLADGFGVSGIVQTWAPQRATITSEGILLSSQLWWLP
jgi:hypothetical protein